MFHLFEKYGIELEYMIVDRDTLRVLPSSDFVMEKACGKITDELPRGEISWSNELVLHVISTRQLTRFPPLKTSGSFPKSISDTNQILERSTAPSSGPMHPFMDPLQRCISGPMPVMRFTRPLTGYSHVKGMDGLTRNMHINLSFAGDEEFGRLHAAIRMVLPIIPALSASSLLWMER